MSLLKLEKVLVSDKIAGVCVDTLTSNGVEVTYKPGLSKTELINIIPAFNGLIVRSATKVTSEVIKAATNLKIIGRAGTGVDNIDIPAASDKGIIVMNTPDGNTNSAAEHTCALILSSCRNLPNRHAELMNGEWNRINGIELQGKTLGIIGLGRIGLIVAQRMQAFGMKTVGYDPFVSKEAVAKHNIKFLELEEMWPACDFLTVHVPLIPPTKHMINAEVFNKCKDGVRIINCARGGIIDEDALLVALNSNKVACAALDVFEQEPPSSDSPLLKHPNLISSPHLGASTGEAQKRVALQISEQFLALRSGTSCFGVMNAPLLSGALQNPAQAQLYMDLGKVLYMLSPKTSAIKISCKDKLGPYAVMSGFLAAKGVDGVNLISIKQLAEQNNLSHELFEDEERGEDTVIAGNDVTLSGCLQGTLSVLTKINKTNCFILLKGTMQVLQGKANLTETEGVAERIAFVDDYTFVNVKENAKLPSPLVSPVSF